MNGRNRPRMCVISSAEFLDRQREPLTSLERRKQRIFAKVEVQGPPAARLLFSIVVLSEARTLNSQNASTRVG